VDLDVFAALVAKRQPLWEQRGIEVEFRRGSTTYPKPSAAVRCEGPIRLSELIVWTSGEADLGTARKDSSDDPAWRIYGIISESDLDRCLDDLAEFLFADD
jgi:hypothetical protein